MRTLVILIAVLMSLNSHAYSVIGKGSVYDRELWGRWEDTNKDCQDTRAELLILRSDKPIRYTNASECVVKGGAWFDVYGGDTFTSASLVDLDHLVPIHWAHTHGGGIWTLDEKHKFFNDPDNIVITDYRLNRKKGDRGPNYWLPPRYHYQCEYIQQFDDIVQKYQLLYSRQEKQFVTLSLANCKHLGHP